MGKGEKDEMTSTEKWWVKQQEKGYLLKMLSDITSKTYKAMKREAEDRAGGR